MAATASALALLVAATSTTSSAPLALTLAQALSAGWRANPGLEQARANLDRAEALVVQARASWLPTLSINGTFTQLDGDRRVADRVTTAASTLNANLLLQAPLLAVPRWQASGYSADARDIAALDLAALQRVVASVVGRAWLQVRLQQRVVEVAERALRASEDQLALARTRSAGGLGTRLDTARNERERADNESRVALARADLEVARDALGAVIGERVPVDIRGEPELPAVPASPDLVRRPDLEAAEARVALAQRRVDQSWTDYLPTLGLALGPFLQTPAYAPAPTVGFQAQVLLSLPIYDGGARSGVSDERIALLRQSAALREQLRLEAETQLRSATTQLRARRVATEAALRSATLAEEALSLAQLAVAEGLGNNLELIDAERSARDAGTNARVVENAAEIAQLDVLIAIGALVPGDAR